MITIPKKKLLTPSNKTDFNYRLLIYTTFVEHDKIVIIFESKISNEMSNIKSNL